MVKNGSESLKSPPPDGPPFRFSRYNSAPLDDRFPWRREYSFLDDGRPVAYIYSHYKFRNRNLESGRRFFTNRRHPSIHRRHHQITFQHFKPLLSHQTFALSRWLLDQHFRFTNSHLPIILCAPFLYTYFSSFISHPSFTTTCFSFHFSRSLFSISR